MHRNIYPKPNEHGGRLIRQVIRELKAAGVALPITSDILIATSGGADSMALAHVLLKYGRRAVDPRRVRLLHINHGWRSGASEADEAFVMRFADSWGVPLILHELDPPTAAGMKGKSWEEVARQARKRIFEKEAQKHQAKILTAHQADDLAETVLWRLLTGAAATHGGGIARAHGVELRPLLKTRKQELKAYLEEEGQLWREDSTNYSGRFLRSKMRRDLMPVIEDLFPRAIEHLVDLAIHAQAHARVAHARVAHARVAQAAPKLQAAELLAQAGIRMRRAHWKSLETQLKGKPSAALDLPGGWRLTQTLDRRGGRRRWVLEGPLSST